MGIYQIAWARKNKERCLELQRKYYRNRLEQNRERNRLNSEKLRKENPELQRERVRCSLQKSAGLHRHKYRSALNGVILVIEWLTLCQLYDFRCLLCQRQTKLEPDHVIPISLGGLNLIENIQPLCRSCNSRKRTNSWDFRIHAFDSVK